MTFSLRPNAFLSLIALVWLLISPAANADIFKLGLIDFSQDGLHGNYYLTAELPAASAPSSEITLPEGCTLMDFQRARTGPTYRLHYSFQCNRPPVGVISTPWRLDGARFTNTLSGEAGATSLLPGPVGLDIPLSGAAPETRSLAQLAETYFVEGILHIWMGWDHLLFVLCLCILYQGRSMIGLVTMFTLGHSVTLGLSYFDVVRLPIAPVEALIAFSILLMAREALNSGGQDHTSYRGLVVVALFGLLHGLGFASALSELGAQPTEKWPALIFFNLGVEVGQVLFVVAVLATLRALMLVRLEQSFSQIAMLGAGCLSGYWFIERLMSF